MKRIGSRAVYEGKVATVRVETWAYDDGSTAEREVISHPGAVTIVPHDGERIWLVRQPREAVGEEDLLELPAGKLDVEGESPLDCARRELVEEAGLEAERWEELKSFYTTPGLVAETMHVFLATGLRDLGSSPDEEEQLRLETRPLFELDAVIDECRDAKSLVGLLLLRDRLRG